MQKGSIFILPPDIPHKIVTKDAENTELYGCEFVESFIYDSKNLNEEGSNFKYLKPFLLPAEKIKPVFTLDGKEAKDIEVLFEDMLFEYHRKKIYFELHIKSDILKMLSILARQYHFENEIVKNTVLKKHKDSMDEVFNYINNNYKNKIYLSDACKIALMSPTYFSYVFKQITGRTFTEYLNYIRVLKAKELLSNYNKSVNEIAKEAGFTDSAYFNRIFKKETGMSPGKFRKFL